MSEVDPVDAALVSTLEFNNLLNRGRQRRGPFYFDRNTKSVQAISSRVLKHTRVVDSLGVRETAALRTPLDGTGEDKYTSDLVESFDPKATPRGRGRREGKNVPPVLPQVLDTPICPECKREVTVLPSSSSSSADHQSIVSSPLFGVVCCDCHNAFHSPCCGLRPEQAAVAASTLSWQCMWCKRCPYCGLATDDKNMMLCSECDAPCHTYCWLAKQQSLNGGGDGVVENRVLHASNKWRCEQCVHCSMCDSRSPSVGWYQGGTLCQACFVQSRRGNVCPSCSKAHLEGSNDPQICCQACKKWVHVNGSCDEGIVTPELFERVGKGLALFTCKICKAKSEEERKKVANNSGLDLKIEEKLHNFAKAGKPEERHVCGMEGCTKTYNSKSLLQKHQKHAHSGKRRRGGRRRNNSDDDDDEDDYSSGSDESFDEMQETVRPVSRRRTTFATPATSTAPAPTPASYGNASTPFTAPAAVSSFRAPAESAQTPMASFKCSECGSVFSSKQAYGNHVATSHKKSSFASPPPHQRMRSFDGDMV